MTFLLFFLKSTTLQANNYCQQPCPIIYDIIYRSYLLDSDEIEMASLTQLHTCMSLLSNRTFLSTHALSVHMNSNSCRNLLLFSQSSDNKQHNSKIINLNFSSSIFDAMNKHHHSGLQRQDNCQDLDSLHCRRHIWSQQPHWSIQFFQCSSAIPRLPLHVIAIIWTCCPMSTYNNGWIWWSKGGWHITGI